jgi:sugar lactone lactonase YvrE
MATALALAAGCNLAPLLDAAGQTTAGKTAQTVTISEAGSGIVRDAKGNPVAGATILAFLVTSRPTAFTNTSPYRVAAEGSGAAAALQAVTDAAGRFKIKPPKAGLYNFEANISADEKAWKAAVSFAESDSFAIVGELKLARTGTLQGVVKAPKIPPGTSLLGVEVYVPGSPYLAKTDAAGNYFLPNMPEGTFDLVAAKGGLGIAQVAGATVKADSRATAPDLVLEIAEPVISSLEPANGASGSVITIRGKQFGFETNEIVKVTFSGAPAAKVERPDGTTLLATVPAGAQSGNVAIEVAGIGSNQVPFQVVKDLSIEPAIADVPVGKDRLLAVKAVDTANRPVPNPAVQWFRIEGEAIALTPGGLITGQGVGSAQIACRIGAIERRLSVTVFRVTGVEVSPMRLDLFVPPSAGTSGPAYPSSGTLKATVTASDRLDRTVTWTSSAETLKVDGSGTVTLLAGAKPGTASIIATSTDDSSVAAIVTVAIGTAKALHVPAIRETSTHASGMYIYGGSATGLAVDAEGNLYVAENVGPADDPKLAKVSKVTPDGAKSDVIPRGTLTGATGLTLDAAGNLFVAEGLGYLAPGWNHSQGNRIWKRTPGGQISAFVASIGNPTGLAFGPDGTLYAASWTDNAVYKYAPSGQLLGKFTDGFDNRPYALAFDKSGNLYVAAAVGDGANLADWGRSGKRIYKVTPAGTKSVYFESTFGGEPSGLAFDAEGYLWATYYNATKLVRIAPDGGAITFPTLDGSLTDAANGIAIDGHANLFLQMNSKRIIKITGLAAP